MWLFASDVYSTAHSELVLLPPANEIWCKVMFSHVSVCLSMGVPPSLEGSASGFGWSVSGSRGVSASGSEGLPLSLGVCTWSRGCAHPIDTHPWAHAHLDTHTLHIPDTHPVPHLRGPQAVGTHPTGMLSCFLKMFRPSFVLLTRYFSSISWPSFALYRQETGKMKLLVSNFLLKFSDRFSVHRNFVYDFKMCTISFF